MSASFLRLARNLPRLLGLALSLLTVGSVHADSKRLDFWNEGLRLFSVAPAGKQVDAGLAERRASSYVSRGFALDPADHRQGDMSVVFDPSAAPSAARFGFVAGLWGERWNLSPAGSLRLWLKTDESVAGRSWTILLVDKTGKMATATVPVPASGWTEVLCPLSSLTVAKDFDWTQVSSCAFEGDFSGLGKIRLDDVRFEVPAGTIGVTDKTLEQRQWVASASREERIKMGFREAANLSPQKENGVIIAFAKMMLNEDLDTANRLLGDELRKSSEANAWSLLLTPIYCRFYYLFSNRVGTYPGRMTPETEKLLLETLWDRTAAKNDIFWARQSTWYLDGSENHDLNAKACNLVTSRIFMNEPEYRDRIYPDYGFGGSYHYGHAGYYGAGVDPATRHGGGRANLADGGKYNAADHYAAWLKYLKTYFRERAQRGFFLEYGSPTYSKHSLNFVDLAGQFGGDEELRRLVDDFFTVFWADWAQVSVAGIRGGPKTRHSTVGGAADRGTADLISFHMGGPANATHFHYWNLVSNYRLPSVVWRMALDRDGMGNFVYRSRGIGEEVNELPRPLGTERTLVVDTDARFLKYAYVTPDYVLGTQMDHPSAVQSHLSVTNRWHGMTFAQSPDARIVPVNLTKEDSEKPKPGPPYDTQAMWQTAQHERTLILQQNRRWYAVHPEWYPVSTDYNQPVAVWMGDAWDRRVERDGWIFVAKGNAYAGVRPVFWDEAYERANKKDTSDNQRFFNAHDDVPTVKLLTNAYRWSKDGKMLELTDPFTTVIIEAGRKADYDSLEAFMADVLDNPLTLYKTVVPGDNILVYTGSGPSAREIVFSCAAPQIPTIGGKPIDYSYPMTWDSPYLRSPYKSGRVKIEFDGDVWERDFMLP